MIYEKGNRSNREEEKSDKEERLCTGNNED